MTAILSAVLFVIVATVSAAPIEVSNFESKAGCNSGPMVQMLSGGNVFLSSSNSSLTLSAGFEGCWSYFPQGPCRAIYRSNSGSYTICGQCDSSGNPGGGRCSPISQNTLNFGYWCS